MPHHRPHHISLVDRFLEGRVHFDQLEEELLAAAARVDRGGIGMRDALGLTPGELAAVSHAPGSLRFILHARRFGIPIRDVLRNDLDLAQSEVDAAIRISDPMDVAALHEAHTLATAHDAHHAQGESTVMADA